MGCGRRKGGRGRGGELKGMDGPDGERQTESKKWDILSKSHYKASKKPGTIYILTW